MRIWLRVLSYHIMAGRMEYNQGMSLRWLHCRKKSCTAMCFFHFTMNPVKFAIELQRMSNTGRIRWLTRIKMACIVLQGKIRLWHIYKPKAWDRGNKNKNMKAAERSWWDRIRQWMNEASGSTYADPWDGSKVSAPNSIGQFIQRNVSG